MIYPYSTSSANAAYSRSDILRELRELNDLKQMGVLTEDEFAEKKQVLLNDLK